jgi:hypothetical protein
MKTIDKKTLPMLQLLETIKNSDSILNMQDIENLIYYYKEVEEKEIESAYLQSTIDQARDISVMFNENEMNITEEEYNLMKINASNFVLNTYK